MRRIRNKCVLTALLVYVFSSWFRPFTLVTTRSKTLAANPKRPSPNSFNVRDAESPRNISRRACVARKFDCQFAQVKFQHVVDACAVGGGSVNAQTSISCDSIFDAPNQIFEGDFSRIHSWASSVRSDSKLVHLVKSATPRVFITGLLHNSCELMYHFVVEVLKFSLIYGDADGFDNVLVSLYSSDTGDCTRSTLEAFKELLDTIGVPNVIETRGRQRPPGKSRIDFLQSIRNEAMKPLYLSEKSFDEVIFLSDAFFCAGDIIRLLRHTEASIKCGLDFDGTTNAMKFRDTWVAHDMSGRMFTKEFPFVHDIVSSRAMNDGAPFQVSCCWNGLLTLRAKVFTDLGARFRRSLDDSECHAAETELICHDFVALGYPKMLVDPQVTVTYTQAEYVALSNSRSSAHSYSLKRTDLFANEPNDTVETWVDSPSITECAPLNGHEGNHPDRGRVHEVDWNIHYSKVGVPVASEKRTISLHECAGPKASDCVLSGGKRVPASFVRDAVVATSIKSDNRRAI